MDLAAVADLRDENTQDVVFNLADNAVIAGALLPELAKFLAVQRLADWAWVVYSGSRIGVPRKHAAKWHFPQENATFRIPEKGHMNSGTALGVQAAR